MNPLLFQMRIIRTLAVVLSLFALTACGLTQPYEAAETPSQRAYAVSATFNVVLQSARDIVVDETLPASVRQVAQNAVLRTVPVVDELDKAVTAFVVERAKLVNAETTEEKMDVVSANLDHWLVLAEQALADLAAAIGK